MTKAIIIDDDELVREIISDILVSNNYDIEVVENGHAALEKNLHSFDVIICDMNMPEMNGIELIHILQKENIDVPVVILTGNDEVKVAIEAMNSGAADYLLKDSNIQNTITISVERVLERHKIKNENIRLMHEREEAYIELKKALEESKRSQEQLIQSEKMASLGKLVADVAHEINTPIGIGVGASSHLAKMTDRIISAFNNKTMTKKDLQEYFDNAREYSEILQTNLKRTGDLIGSFKKISADQTSQKKRAFNVKSYLEEVILTLKPEIKKTKHSITLKCDDDIEIDSYPGGIAQIITNLLMNSLIHGYNPNDEGNIEIDVKSTNNTLSISYFDDGKGIDNDDINKIFEPFFTTRRGHGGTGLGLHIVYNIVHNTLKGSIRCESAKNEGTKFFINFPKLLR